MACGCTQSSKRVVKQPKLNKRTSVVTKKGGTRRVIRRPAK